MALVTFLHLVHVLQGSKKGDAIVTVEIAGIQEVKAVPSLVPMCHLLSLDSLLSPQPTESTVTCHGKTGVEMRP
jgi:molybdenum cofactor biosynthesis enzyme